MPSTARKRTTARLRTALSLASFDGARIHREVQQAGTARIFSLEDAPRAPSALILGAPARDGQVTAVLEDRLLTGAGLLARGTVASLCCTGTPEEVAVMAAFLAEHDVPGNALTLDPRGRHTFESIENACTLGHTELLVVSQRFHLPRALYICRALGLQASGVAADLRPYQSQHRLEQRELFSSVLAYWMCA